ncbi:MAG: cyclophilin-like fold protein [Dehalococcoidales bacterium]|nr:cyclophilin-like fold protein [Dehalococcoidales bacterium]
MNKDIKIVVGGIEAEAILNDTKTAGLVYDALPITSEANLWGDEIYFYVTLHTGVENGKEIVALGDIAYWPEGPALCIFLGKTPISRGNEIRPASAVNVIGKIKDIDTLLRKVKDGEKITVRR